MTKVESPTVARQRCARHALRFLHVFLLSGSDVRAKAFGFSEVDVNDFALFFVRVPVQQNSDAVRHRTWHGDFGSAQQRNLAHADGSCGFGRERRSQVRRSRKDDRADFFEIADSVSAKQLFQHFASCLVNFRWHIVLDRRCSSDSPNAHFPPNSLCVSKPRRGNSASLIKP